jgi:glutathione synthase
VHTLFVMDPLDRIQVDGDSTYLMMREATDRDWPVCWCEPGDVFIQDQLPMARVRPVTTHADAPHFRQGEPRVVPLSELDCVWMRKDPPFDMDYVFTTYMLDLALPGTMVLNDPGSIKLFNEKMVALQYPDLCPETLVTNRVDHVKAFAQRFDRVVLKPWDGNGGRGIVVTHAGDTNLAALVELLTDEGRGYCIAQRHLPEIQTVGDKRIILVDGEPMGWFLRVPGDGDHRGNMHVGARVVACELTERDREICDRVAPLLKESGLVFVGIDVIGDYMTEINVTSPTGLHEIRDLMGVRLERAILDAQQARAT